MLLVCCKLFVVFADVLEIASNRFIRSSAKPTASVPRRRRVHRAVTVQEIIPDPLSGTAGCRNERPTHP